MTSEDEQGSGFGFEVIAKLNLAVDGLASEMRSARERQQRLSQNIWALSLPKVVMPGVTSTYDVAAQFAPATGQVWDLRRIAVAAMTTGTLNVRLDDAVNGELIASFTAADVKTYGKGVATVVSNRRLCFQATGTGTAAEIWVAGIQMAEAVFADYLL